MDGFLPGFSNVDAVPSLADPRAEETWYNAPTFQPVPEDSTPSPGPSRRLPPAAE